MTPYMISFLLSLLLLLGVTIVSGSNDEGVITCGSVIKLTHVYSGVGTYHLWSSDMQMGGGSGQQIVSWIKNDPSTTKSLWQVRPKHHGEEGREFPAEDMTNTCTRTADPVKCGSVIRLTHVATRTNLHSHGVQSALSRQQEVTSFGQGDGKGDAGDNWQVECTASHWHRGQSVRLKHVDTNVYLGGTTQATFNANNCGHACPIMNHLEAFGRKSKDDLSVLQADLGIYISK